MRNHSCTIRCIVLYLCEAHNVLPRMFLTIGRIERIFFEEELAYLLKAYFTANSNGVLV